VTVSPTRIRSISLTPGDQVADLAGPEDRHGDGLGREIPDLVGVVALSPVAMNRISLARPERPSTTRM
jgi:hypothetical protein